MFKLQVMFKSFYNGEYIPEPREYFFEICDELNIDNITISECYHNWYWYIIFDSKKDRSLFIKQKPERITSLTIKQANGNDEFLARRDKYNYKTKKERQQWLNELI